MGRVILMPYARNRLDGSRVYFEEDGPGGVAVVLHGGLMDSVDLVRGSNLAQGLPPDEFRLIYVDQRGHGRSDKPHDPAAYAMPLRVADAVSVLDELRIDRAHFIGLSWGGRLGFGIGEHAPERVLSLIIGGQQPYAMDPDGSLAMVAESLALSRMQGSMVPFVEALEASWGLTIPEPRRSSYLDNDPAAMEAAWSAGLAEGAISEDLGAWRVRCLIFLGEGDDDFIDQARTAAGEIPNAMFISLEQRDHFGAHVDPGAVLLDAVLSTLRDGR